MNDKTYTASRGGGGSGWRAMALELWGSRELIAQLAYRDIAVKYRQSYLGYLWAVLPQLVTVAIFSFLVSRRVFDMGETDMPYVLFALWNVSVWQLFSVSLVNCTNSLTNAGTLVTKVQFSKECLVIAAIVQPCIDFLVRLVPIAMAMAWFGFAPPLYAILLIPLVLLLIVILALSLGFFLSIANLVVRDMGNALTMLLTFAMFLAPVLYPPPTAAPFNLVNVLNPFSPLLIATQNILMGQPLVFPGYLLAMCLISTALLFFGWRTFVETMPRIAERA